MDWYAMPPDWDDFLFVKLDCNIYRERIAPLLTSGLGEQV